MDIFYINSDDFLKVYDTNFLRNYVDGKEFKSTKRFLQYSIGRYLVKTAAEKIYGLKDFEIVIENDKPKFKNGGIYFNISHSGKYIAAVFDDAECGLDIEEIKNRNFEILSERYEKEFKTAEDFYEFWTEYEAGIKLGQKCNSKYTCTFKHKYILTVVSVKPSISGLNLKAFNI